MNTEGPFAFYIARIVSTYSNVIVLRYNDMRSVIPINKIISITSDNDYCYIYCGNTINVSPGVTKDLMFRVSLFNGSAEDSANTGEMLLNYFDRYHASLIYK
jgi:hypothetical protein